MNIDEKSKLRRIYRESAMVYLVMLTIFALMLDWYDIKSETFKSIAMVMIPCVVGFIGVDYMTKPSDDRNK